MKLQKIESANDDLSRELFAYADSTVFLVLNPSPFTSIVRVMLLEGPSTDLTQGNMPRKAEINFKDVTSEQIGGRTK